MKFEPHSSFLFDPNDEPVAAAGSELLAEPQLAQTSEPSNSRTRWLVQILVILVVFFGLIAVVWKVLTGEAALPRVLLEPEAVEEVTLPGPDPRVTKLLQNASLPFARDHLTLPEGDNALEVYLQARKLVFKEARTQAGIDAIGARYLQMIEDLTQEQNERLLAATLDSAEKVVPHVWGDQYAASLVRARAELENLQRELQRRREAAPATRWQNFEVFRDTLKGGGSAPPMIYIPGGRFTLGSPSSEPYRDADEGPQQAVTVAPFAIGQTEVTFAEFDVYAKSVGRQFPNDSGWGRGDLPVINVTWYDARDYAVWLSAQTGARYRLPTEAEWEFAARAGTVTEFSTGTCLDTADANFNASGSADLDRCQLSGVALGRTRAVKVAKPNAWGLYETHGNVREWVQDCWQRSYEGVPLDGGAWFAGEGGKCGLNGQRVLRGGAWDSNMRSARVANRYGGTETQINPNFGIRLARDVDF